MKYLYTETDMQFSRPMARYLTESVKLIFMKFYIEDLRV